MKAQADQLESILAEAVEIETEAERLAFVERACAGDEELRRRVEELVENHFQAGVFLESPVPDLLASGRASSEASVAERPGTVIGPYKLLEQIGEGGFGVVFMAEQHRPVHRKVALKVVKPGMDTRQVVARFEAERQALALMDHSGIAHVFDGGETPSGRPYFVMELVRGVPITDFCDDNHLSVRERLELFTTVCDAVQHAHQKGVIHRDLKPPNVMVTMHDRGASGVVKVIDFGIAKATGPQLTDKTLSTNFAQMLGTPMYMSPEQAQMSPGAAGDIDTRTDIYSLGVLLYEVLTGMTPFDKERLRSATFDEIRRIVREEEPPKPSTRLTELGKQTTAPLTPAPLSRRCGGRGDGGEGDSSVAQPHHQPSLASIAAMRHTAPAKLSKLIRGELDWIVMKALEKDRDRRYESAAAFAADVRRYLDDQPVLACPPTVGYRLRKFLRRNKGAVLAASLLFLSLLGGIIGTSWGMVCAEKARTAESVRAEGERQARLAAEEAEQAARESEADTKAFSDFLVNDVLWVPRPAGERGGMGIDVTVRQALEAAEDRIDTTFQNRPRAEAVARHALGVTFRLIGEPQRAESHLRRATALRKEALGHDHEDTLQSQNSLGVLLVALGKHVEATPLLEETLKLRKATLGPDHPHTLYSMVNLAWSYQAAGQVDRALPLYEEAFKVRTATLGLAHPDTLSSMGHLASGYLDARRLDLALPLAEESLKLRRATLVPDHTETLASMNVLASCYQVAGKFDLALPLAEEALKLQTAKLGPEHPDTISSMMIVASCYRATRKLDRAMPLYEKALELRSAKLGSDHRATLVAMNNLAWAYHDARKFDLALPLAEEALKLQTAKLGPDHPDTLSSMVLVASCYVATRNPGPALPLYEKLLNLQREKLGSNDPVTLTAMYDLARAYRLDGQLELALPLLQEAAAGMEKRRFIDKEATSIVYFLVRGHEQLQQFDQAEVWQRKLLAIVQKNSGPNSESANMELAILGSNLLAQKKFVDAETVLRECLAFREKISPDGWLTFNAQSLLGAALLGQDKYTEAEPLLLQGYEGLKKREAQIPAQFKDVRLREAMERLVQLYDAWDQLDRAAEWRTKLDAEKAR